VHLQKKKECNKLDLTAAQYFWFVIHNDWSMWFAVKSPPVHAVFQLQFYWWGCQKHTAKLKHVIILSRVTYWAPVEMLLVPWPIRSLIILFSKMLKFSKIISSKSKNIVKENSEYLGIFYLLKLIFLIIYLFIWWICVEMAKVLR